MYGREEAGLLDDEIAACDCTVSIPIGRLQESLSLSHAVSITLSQLYQVGTCVNISQTGCVKHCVPPQQRLDALGNAEASQYAPTGTGELAAGWRPQGKER